MTRMVSIRFTRAELEAVIQAAAIARVEGFTLAAELDAALERARAKLREGLARVKARTTEAKVDAPDPLDRTQTGPKTGPKTVERR
jgi:hypothetical protein